MVNDPISDVEQMCMKWSLEPNLPFTEDFHSKAYRVLTERAHHSPTPAGGAHNSLV